MTQHQLETWTPTVIAEDGPRVYVAIMAEGSRCACCKRVMLVGRGPSIANQPPYFRTNLGAQVERAGWCLLSGSSKDQDPICVDCERAGSGRFSCSLCHKERDGRPVEWWDGDALCQHCYETVSAKVWSEKKRELEEAHRYDYC